jgi:hypothetical protein
MPTGQERHGGKTMWAWKTKKVPIFSICAIRLMMLQRKVNHSLNK